MATRHRIVEAFLSVALLPRRMANRLSRLTPGAISPALMVVSIDGQWLKILQVEGPLRARRITKLVAAPVESSAPEAVDRLFKEACGSEGMVAREVLVATPTHLSTVRLFTLPSTDSKEIRDIVDLQAEKHTPYAKEEVLIDFKILDRDPSGYSRVALVIAHQDIIHRQVRLAETTGLSLDRIGCELEGLMNWFHLIRRGGGKGGGGGATLLVDVDGNTTTFMVMQRGQPQFYRSLAIGAEQLEGQAAEAGQRLIDELQRSLEAIELEGGASKVQEIVMTGRVERLEELKGLMGQAFGLSVSAVSPWQGCEASERVRVAIESLPSVSFASLVGLAFASSHVDLTPSSAKLRQAFEARARALVLLACQGLAALILVSLLVIERAQKVHQQYETLRARHQSSIEQAGQVEEALRQVAFVKERLRQRGPLLEMAKILAEHSPDGIEWKSLTFADGGELTLKGISEELPKIYEYVAALGRIPPLEQAAARRVAKRKLEARDVTEFEISCPLSAPGVAPTP